MRARLASFLADLDVEHAGERVVVVAHDAVVLMMRAAIEGLAWDEVIAVERAAGSIRNASISQFLARDGRLELVRYNDVDHLPSV